MKLIPLAASMVERFARSVPVSHPHLAPIREVCPHTNEGAVLVEECVDGTSLAQRLRETERLPVVDTVRALLRITDAVGALHDAGCPHGEIVPAAIVVDPEGRPGPIVIHLGLQVLPAGYQRPEHQPDQAPSSADDAWALAALLHEMLTGRPPPEQGLDSSDAISAQDVEDRSLRELLARYLSHDPQRRHETLAPLKHALARWYAQHAGDEAVPASMHPHEPPPLPSHAAPGPAGSLGKKPPLSPGKRVLVLALSASGILLGLAAAWTYASVGQRDAATPPSAMEGRGSTPATPAASDPIELGEVPVTGSRDARARDQRASCVAGYLHYKKLDEATDLGWLCSETVANRGAHRLRKLLQSDRLSGNTGQDPKQTVDFGWYWIPAFALVRDGCCTDPPPLTLPDPGPECRPILESVRELSRRVLAAQPLGDTVDEYTAGIACEVRGGRAAEVAGELKLSGEPRERSRLAFSKMLSELAQP